MGLRVQRRAHVLEQRFSTVHGSAQMVGPPRRPLPALARKRRDLRVRAIRGGDAVSERVRSGRRRNGPETRLSGLLLFGMGRDPMSGILAG